MSVRLVEYDTSWPARFAGEASRVATALGTACAGVEHIGSTSVPGLPAKPVIDLLVALHAPLSSRESRALRRLGYVHLRARRDGRLVFRRGTPREFSLHVVEIGSRSCQAALFFRDYLRVWPEEAARYAQLKRRLARVDSRAAYGAGKGAFIRAALREAAPRGALAETGK
jgi:GrpB-like predicted nucleotidyltransferase (UPF0157 family)